MTDLLPGFSFQTAGKILFGRGQAAIAPDHICSIGTRVALVQGASLDRAAWLSKALEERGCALVHISCTSEPTLAVLQASLEVLRPFSPDVVVALGGGSVIDLGKALAALVAVDGVPLDYLEVVGNGKSLDRVPVPFVAMPTTAGTGAEVTKNAVIGVPEAKRKVSLRDDRMIADIAIIDPALTDGTPRSVTLAVGLDAITQVIEPFVSTKSNPLTDALCRPAIATGLSALRHLMDDEDPAARDQMSWVSLCGGLALANAGLGAVHGLAGVIGGVCPAPHGAVCGTLLPHVLRANYKAPEIEDHLVARLNEVLEIIAMEFGVADRLAGLDRLQGWAKDCGIPSLAQMGISLDDHAMIAENAQVSSSMRGNPVRLSVLELEDILAAAS